MSQEQFNEGKARGYYEAWASARSEPVSPQAPPKRDTTIGPYQDGFGQGWQEGWAKARGEAAAPPPAPPAAKKKRSKGKLVLAVLGGLLLIGFIGSLGGDDEPTTVELADAPADEPEPADEEPPAVEEPAEPEPEQPAEPEPEEVVPGVGEPAIDGQFTFTVTGGLDCGATTLGEDFLAEEAQGHFCLLPVTIANTGDQPQTMFADNQYLLDADGVEYAANSSATLFALEQDVWLTEINPGNSIEGTIAFDVPPDRPMTQARLHDSVMSGGVTVDLE